MKRTAGSQTFTILAHLREYHPNKKIGRKDHGKGAAAYGTNNPQLY
jgi:hypothetical protein